MRTGLGYDIHRLTEGRKLILGGVEIPHPAGLTGHSDADVLCHAVMDALLGAAGMGDIGQHFPDTNPRYRDISSLDLMIQVRKKVENAGYRIINVDSTVIAQAPRLAPFRERMILSMAEALGILQDQISVKATTQERLDSVGREESIAALAVVLIEKGPWKTA